MEWDICRICMNNTVDLFSIYSPITEDSDLLSDLIVSAAAVEISKEDGLPQNICQTCSDDAIQTYNFINKCQYSHTVLRKKLNLFKLEKIKDENLLIMSAEEVEIAIETDDEMSQIEYLDVELVTDEGNDENNDSAGNENSSLMEHLNENTKASEVSILESVETNGVLRCCGNRCRMTFGDVLSLMTHISTLHEPDRQLRNAEKPFECETCYARFESKRNLCLHRRRIITELRCHICYEYFSTNAEKRCHIEKEHSAEERKYAKPIKYDMNEFSERICCDCKASFGTEAELRKHGIELHSSRKVFDIDIKEFQCKICFKYFKSNESLRTHQLSVYKVKKFICRDCGKGCDTKSRLAAHEAIHKEVRNFKCDKCAKAFKKIHDLNAHKNLHEEKKEVCQVCGLKFHRKSNLRLHLRQHSDSFDFPCLLCTKKFRTNSHLKEHCKSHSGDKPFHCQYCDRKFAYYSDRKRHEMTHTGNYPFVCVCQRKFSRRPVFEKHQKSCIGIVSDTKTKEDQIV